MSCARPSSLSRTKTALRSSSAIAVMCSFAILNSASSRSIATFLTATEHPTLPGPPLCALLRASRSAVGLSLLGGCAPIGESIEPVRGKARAGVGLDVSGLQQFIDQAIAFATPRVHAYAECRSSHRHVWG